MREIYRVHDAYGPLVVSDDGNKRFLSFGRGDEQSCVLKQTPAVPQYAFIRAMLLPLLYIEPRSVLCLGLGAGSLNSALHIASPRLKQDIVELREAVVALAHRYFFLPHSSRIRIRVGDAFQFIAEPPDRQYQMIFSDLYTADGICAGQLQEAFVLGVTHHLATDGWLVLNCWHDHRADDILDLLSDHFDTLFSCTTQDGNWILYATNSAAELSQSQFKTRSKQLSDRMGFAIGALAKRMKRLK